MNWDKFASQNAQIQRNVRAKREKKKKSMHKKCVTWNKFSYDPKYKQNFKCFNSLFFAFSLFLLFSLYYYYFYAYNNNNHHHYLRIRDFNSFLFVLQWILSVLVGSKAVKTWSCAKIPGIPKYDAYQYCSCFSFKTKLCKQATWISDWSVEENKSIRTSSNNEKLLIYLCILRAWVENCWNN